MKPDLIDILMLLLVAGVGVYFWGKGGDVEANAGISLMVAAVGYGYIQWRRS